MKKVFSTLFIMVLMVSAFSLSIKDGKIFDENDWSVELKEYNSIVLIDPSTTEVAFLLGAEDKVKAIGHTSRSPIWPYDKTVNMETVGTITKPSLEKVLYYKPDLVILNGMITEFGETLRGHDINVLTMSADGIEDILDNLEISGIIFGKEREAIEMAQTKKALLKKIKKDIKKKPLNMKGAFLYSTNPIMGFNADSLPGQILEIMGVENITNGITAARPILSPEYILKENPDFLIGAMSIKKPEDILNASPMINKTNAGKNKNILLVDSSKILRPSPRIIEEIESLYEELSNINN
ncbi:MULTISPECIES: ABC transporter substrate-binding protein [Oceanotoga]|uniref:ABC transporter substrate-binding protein n=1 Tax=Oceanotoga TaxID=1255275 RepID=UPI002655EBCC|nr:MULTISPECIES: ABC transporter substrate-binding protein [Oceanotoga]MDN5341987.1 cobalamin transport system substrate-binding protein [Oceanotoga sp.]MDO7976054.1 ABC transporter substrate-binding protein [Oceanotoga teriensis]